MQVDIEIVIYAAIAAFVIGRLWYVLGAKKEKEQKRTASFVKPAGQDSDATPCNKDNKGNIIASNDTAAQKRSMPSISIRFYKMPAGMMENNKSLPVAFLPPNSLAGGLALVQKIIPNFDEKGFIKESKDIFSSIVQAFHANNLSCVSSYLSESILNTFQDVINDGSAEQSSAKLLDAEIISAKADDKQVLLTVRFLSKSDSKEEIEDFWTFTNQGTNWLVVETR